MKRVILSLLALTAMVRVAAQTVDYNKARLVAEHYIAINEPEMAGLSVDVTPEKVYTDYSGTPVMYVFNIGDTGFIIAGANKSFSPIVGYSFNGSYDSERLPENLKAWLEGYVEDVSAVKSSSQKNADILAAQNAFQAEWKALEHSDPSYYAAKGGKAVSALVETRWDQGAGYNNYCPAYSGSYDGHSVTGCVATAMAQIIRYHRYPNVGYSRRTYSHAYYGQLSADFDLAYYDYTKMPISVNAYSNSEYQNAVSLLCYHCGVAVKMNYQNPQHTSGSGAHSESVPEALMFFGYLNTFYLNKTTDNNFWDSLLHHDLDLGRPVYYSGSSSEGGHAFVCDGYKSNGRYHFNFGWGGGGDGYYTLSSVNGYSSGQGAVFNIYPCNMGPMHDTLYIAADGQGNGSSWSSAYPDLNSAMKICSLYKKGNIWVKNGIYYGDTTADASFTASNKTTIYGGFAGTESRLEDRNLNAGSTILSGGGKRRVFLSAAPNNECKIYDVTFADGKAETGAGVYIQNSSQRLERCIIENNTSTAEGGAAVYSNTGNLFCCIIRNNHSGAVDINGGMIKNSLIVHNAGYGIRSQGTTIDGCDIVCNSGCGAINQNRTTIRNSVIWHNDSSLTNKDISGIRFCAIEGFGETDSNSNFGISRINRPAEGKGPFFIAPDTTMGPADDMGDWRLSSFSPLVDAGDTNRVGAYITELAGDSRFRNGRADIGCYEKDPFVGIETTTETTHPHIYPNPATTTLCVEGTTGALLVIDAMGRRILTVDSDNDRTVIDISSLPRGVYFIRTNNATSKFVKK